MTDLASAENEEVILGGNNRDRDCSWTYLPDCFNAVKCMHEHIFSVITSGVICVLSLDSHSDDMHMQLLHAHFTTCNCSMHIQHMQLLHATAPCTFSTCMHVLAQARPTMSCIPLVVHGRQNFNVFSVLQFSCIFVSAPKCRDTVLDA